MHILSNLQMVLNVLKVFNDVMYMILNSCHNPSKMAIIGISQLKQCKDNGGMPKSRREGVQICVCQSHNNDKDISWLVAMTYLTIVNGFLHFLASP